MKKRTSLVCFLIFTLCVFYTAIPNAVFGQEDGVSLANKVFDNPESKKTLLREDVKAFLPSLLEGLKEAQSPIPIPSLIDTAISLVATPEGEASLKAIAAGQGITLTDDHVALIKDPDVQALLTNADTKALLGLQGEELDKGLTELLRLINEASVEVPDPVDPDPVDPDPVDPDPVDPPPMVEVPMADPFASVPLTNLSGKSRLGGLSVNNASGRRFLRQFITALAPGLPSELIEQYQEDLVDAVLREIPEGFLPKKQIRQILLAERLTPFAQDAPQLDYENFGNAIMPNVADFAYSELSSKYLTSDSLHLYARVPAKVAGVTFELTGGITKEATEVTPDEFGADTIPYTFRLEETLAATNLPAWPGLDNAQLFSEVRIRYSTTGPMGNYLSDVMTAVDTGNGVVWEKQLGIHASGSIYYYFEVELAEPLLFSTLDRDAIAGLDPTTVTLDDVFAEENQHKLEIAGWAMPDPRNLQLADRGILDELFTDLEAEFTQILTSPQVISALGAALTGERIDINQVLQSVTPNQLRRIQSILLRNATALATRFETEFDPLLASVFSIPHVDMENHSLWVAPISITTDGNYQVKADVLDADGTVLDRIQENITVDTSAPEADIGIIPTDANTTGYLNTEDNIYYATAPTAGTSAMLNIKGMPKAADIGPGVGYLFYQMIGLNEDGTPYLGEPLTHRPNTWMPLTVESTMLVSNIWEAVKEAVAEGRIDAPSDPILTAALALPLSAILGTDEAPGILTAELIKQYADPFLKGLEPFIGFSELNINQYQLIIEALGATVDILDYLVPVTFTPNGHVVMPIQGEQMPLLVGDYGIRAMGIDTLFNVGAYAAPTHLRIVDPNTSVDRASIMNANIGDFNNDGIVHEVYETGIIYANTDNVMITGAVENLKHPIQSIVLQYKDASGNWTDIGEATVMGANFEANWNVTDFDALIGAGDTVMVRAMATNALELTDTEPMEFAIKLDAGIYPPEVLDVKVDEASITQMNPDSGAPQGMVTINATTLPLTGPRTTAVRFEAKRENDAEWITIGTANQSDPQAIVDAVADAVDTAIGGTNAPINTGNLTWSITVDTTTLEDTITKSSPGARDVSMDDNRYTIRAFAVSGDATEWSSDAMAMLSVDNVDDVEPLGPTNITAIANAEGAVEADPDGGYTLRGLVDAYDPSVVPQILKLTIEPTAERKTYKSVMLVSDPVIDANVIGNPVEISEGVFEITVNIGELGIAGNRAYTLHALAYDGSPDGPDAMYGNLQTDPSPERTVHVKNYLRPNPTVVELTVDDGTGMNGDSGGPQGTFVFTGYTLEQSSPPIMSIRLEAKRESDPDTAWQTIGTGDVSKSVDIEDGALPNVLYHLVEAIEGDKSVVEIDATYRKWLVSVDSEALGLLDTITNESPAARDASLDDNQYMVRTYAVDTDGNESLSDATAMFSLDNVDDVAPLGPTNVSVTSVSGTNAFVRADGNGFTVGGLVDKYDNAVPSPVATFTVEPTADRETYDSVRFVPGVSGLLITDVNETAAGSGVFELTVDVGTLADGKTYLANGTYMFYALASDEFGNEQEDDGTRTSVRVANSYRPPPQVLSISVDPASITQRNVDSGGPQGTIRLNARTPAITSPPVSSMYFEVKRPSDTTWRHVGTSTVKGAWTLQVNTTTLEDTITKDNPGARDHTLDNNQYVVRATAIAAADGSRTRSPAHVTARFSVDNVDDVGPLEPTKISVTNVAAIDSILEDAGDGSFTVGGLVDKYDEAVPSPVATLTIEPAADRKTYKSVRLTMYPEGILMGEVAETAEGSGVFTVTVDIGTLADGMTYLENGTYVFQALAFDEFDNVEANTDASKASVTVANSYRPAPEVLALAVDPESITQTNPDSGAPQGTLMLQAYSHEISSPPTTAVRFEVKRSGDAEWIDVGTANESIATTEVSDASLSDLVGDLVNTAVSTAETTEGPEEAAVDISQTYQMWAIEVDTTTLEDTITKDSGDAARDHTKDENQYMVRAVPIEDADDFADPEASPNATAMFSVDNVDDVAPLGPTNVSVTNVEAIDSVLEDAGDGSFTVGGLVDKYDEAVPSPVATFTLKPTAERKTYKSVRFVTDTENLVISDVTETEEGSGVFTVTVDVGTLADGETYLENGTYMFYALAFDEFGNEQEDMSETDGSKASVAVENSYRPAPEVLALSVDPESITQTNPDSGAPQGTITVHAYSHEISSPPTTAVRIEVKRQGDAEWIDVGTATESVPATETDVSDATLTDFVGDLATAAVSATEAADGTGETVVPISRNYQMWAIEVDTTTLEDTITADSPAARDASKDENQYMVRAVPIEAAEDFADPEASPNATAMFSVDNVDDVAPLGPTNIIAVADVAGMIEANEDGSYTVGGIVDDTVPSPIAIFTAQPTADPITYASANLVQTTGDSAETVAEGGAGVFDLTIDVGMLENGTYMFHALAVDEFGNVQTDESPMVTVHVLNFRVSDVTDIAVIAVDGADVAEPPAEPIPLRNSVTVSFMVANGSLAVEELSGAVDGSAVPSESAEDPENAFSLMVEVGGLVDGVYTPDAVVTQRNGSVPFPITTVNVDNTGPMVTIESPTAGDTVDSLPTLRATYHDGAGSGVDGATGSLALARLQPPNETEVAVDQAELEKDAASLVYTRSEPLAGGAYRVTVQVTDNLGNVGEGSAEFAVNGTLPTVAIHSPAPGQTFEHGEPLVSGEFSGIGSEVTTFTINDIEVTPEVDGNQFSYTPDEALANGDYKVIVAVTDDDGNMAQTSVVFMVDIPEPPKDTTPPVISTVAPSGLIKLATHGAVITLSAVVSDEQSDIASVKFRINDGALRSVSTAHIKAGEISISELLEPGQYTAEVVATSAGGTTKHSWAFTLVFDDVKPTITSITPSGTIRGGLPVISASASDESGIDKMTIAVMDSAGEEVKGKTADDAEENVEGITRLDFNPEEPLDEGIYTIEVRATDTVGNSATAKGSFTIDFDTAAPIITLASPHQNARFKLKPGEKAPTVSVAYADAESGINVDSVTLVIEGAATQYRATPSGTKITLKPGQKSASQVMYPLSVDTNAKPETWAGEYVVRLEVADNADQEGNVSEKNKGAREANRTVHTFSFFLEAAEGPIMAARPINYPNPFKDKTRISFTLTRQATVSIVIYDATLRPVRVLVDNRLFDAGNYTLKENGSDAIGWDGKSSNGEDLARGIYFCEMIVTDGFEPEYVILKLALTR